MNNAPLEPARTPPVPTKTELSAEERRSGAVSRKVAFTALGVIAIAACLVAPYSWYLWTVTASECVNTYMAGGTPKLLQGTAAAEGESATATVAETWQEQFIALDISSFSALILALMFTRLAYVGVSNIVQWAWRQRGSYFDHAHHNILFSESFDTLAIRLGLLGTLLSFLLAALTLRHDQSSEPLVTKDPALASASAVDVPERNEPDATTSELSGRMFLLLCASLVSTFVGTGVAYVITPSLNWLHDRAVGRHQIGDAEAELVAEEFFRQIARTSERLAQFETTTARLSEVVEHIARFETNVGQSSQQLASLLASLQSAIQTFEISNRTGQELAKKLEIMESQNSKLQAVLARLPDALANPLESISRTSQRFKEAAQSGEAAFRELKDAAGSAHESLKENTQRSKVTWKALHEIRDSLSSLAQSDRMQADEVAKLVEAMQEASQALGSLLSNSATVEPAAAGPHAAARSTPMGHAPPPVMLPVQGDVRHARPWWRRLLG